LWDVILKKYFCIQVIYSTGYYGYCNDSLGIYTKVFGDFDKNMFFNKKLDSKAEYVTKKISFNRKQDKILFYSDTKIENFYSVIGILKNKIDLTKYEKEHTDKGIFYKRILFKKYGIYEAVFPINDKFFSLVLYEKKQRNKLINIFDYEAITNYTLELMAEKKCEKYNFNKLSNSIFYSDSLGDYLTYKNLKNYQNDLNKKEIGYFLQYLATYYSFAKRYYQAEETFQKVFKNYYFDKKIELNYISKENLLDKIKNEKLVIFNEAHHFPIHRYLVGKLLKEFYNQGFRYLGLEALKQNNSLERNGFPTLSDGFYVKEFNFSNLIREAKNIGFYVFGYDSFDNDREYNQAKNIFEKTFQTDQNAKVLILCGYGHIDENQDKKRMANHFKTSFNIDPYTIEQASYRDKTPTNTLFLLISEDNNMECDLYINNSLIIKNNCFELRESKDVDLKIPYSFSAKEPGIILIYEKKEFEGVSNPVPVFLEVVENNENNITTNLCNGNYVYIIKNQRNDVVYKNEFDVN